MAEETGTEVVVDSSEEAAISRVYEIGYHIAPSIKEEELEKAVGNIRSQIEKAGGSFIAEGAPSLIRLAYGIEGKENGKRVEYDRVYFGWIKFEATVAGAHALEASLKQNADIARFIVFRTVREDTRAKMKPQTLREVKRTDIIKSTPRRPEEVAAPVSEEELEKAISEITSE